MHGACFSYCCCRLAGAVFVFAPSRRLYEVAAHNVSERVSVTKGGYDDERNGRRTWTRTRSRSFLSVAGAEGDSDGSTANPRCAGAHTLTSGWWVSLVPPSLPSSSSCISAAPGNVSVGRQSVTVCGACCRLTGGEACPGIPLPASVRASATSEEDECMRLWGSTSLVRDCLMSFCDRASVSQAHSLAPTHSLTL